MLEKALKLMVRVFFALVPAIALPSKTICTPYDSSSEAYIILSLRFVLASVISEPIGFCAPVNTIGLGEF